MHAPLWTTQDRNWSVATQLPCLSDGQVVSMFLKPFLTWSRLSFPQKTLLLRLFKERRRGLTHTRAAPQRTLWGKTEPPWPVYKAEGRGASVISLPNRGRLHATHRSILSDTRASLFPFPASVLTLVIHIHPSLYSSSFPTLGSLSRTVSFVHLLPFSIPWPTLTLALEN